MKHKTLLSLVLLTALAACGKSALETTFASQSDKIDSYVTKQLESHPEYRVVYDEGVVRMVVAEGEGDEAAKGDRVTFYYAGYNFNNSTIGNSTLFATNDPDIAASARWTLSDTTRFQALTVTLGKDRLVIKDNFSLSKSVSPNLVNFMTWGDVDITTPGVVRIKASGKSAVIEYDKRKFTPSLEKIALSDPALSNIWNKALYRVILTARGTQLKDSYTFTVREAD